MEPYTHYLIWMKSKHVLNSMIINNSSWEEQAFAEDAAGPLGGFVWPPRSYSCSFCKREFRSAQALGGHMNVHRRDRARLKQSLSSATEALDGQSMAAQNQSHNRNLLGPSYVSSSSSVSSGSRVFAIFSQESSSDQHAYISHPFSSSLIDKECSKRFLSSLSPPSFDSNGVRVLGISNSSTTTVEKNRKKEESMVLNHDETIKCKRHKTTAVSPLPLLHKPCSSDRYRMQEDAVRIKVNSMEDIDLELRLGDPPAVK